MLDFDLEALEASVMAAPPSSVAPLPEALAQDVAQSVLSPDLMTLEEFSAGWAMCHHVGGGMISARIGAQVDLGRAAMDATGQEACKAVYELARKHAPFMLSKSNGTFGKVAAIAMHGIACIALIKSARMEAMEGTANEVPEFRTTRKEAAE